jgi:hypothetical protein
MEHKDLTERELLLLAIQKLDTSIQSNEKDHGNFEKRLDSHSNQLKLLWGGGGLVGIFSGWIGMKGHQ